jgi:hypothetical protein
MFEEDNHNIKPQSARMKACLNQCRLQRLMTGGDMLSGGCTCDDPAQCRFNLGRFVKDKMDLNADFADVDLYYQYLRGE